MVQSVFQIGLMFLNTMKVVMPSTARLNQAWHGEFWKQLGVSEGLTGIFYEGVAECLFVFDNLLQDSGRYLHEWARSIQS